MLLLVHLSSLVDSLQILYRYVVFMSTVVLLSAAGSCFSSVMVEVGYTPRYRFLWHLLTSRLRRSVNTYHRNLYLGV